MAKKILCPGKRREFGKYVKTQEFGLLNILKVKHISIVCLKVPMYIFVMAVETGATRLHRVYSYAQS